MRNSTSGRVVLWQNAPLSWGSRKQKCVSLSSCESEIYALSEAAKDMVYFRKLVRGLEPSTSPRPSLLALRQQGRARPRAQQRREHSRLNYFASACAPQPPYVPDAREDPSEGLRDWARSWRACGSLGGPGRLGGSPGGPGKLCYTLFTLLRFKAVGKSHILVYSGFPLYSTSISILRVS